MRAENDTPFPFLTPTFAMARHCPHKPATMSRNNHLPRHFCQLYTDKKDNKIFLIYKEIQMGSRANSHEEGLPNIYGNAQILYMYYI